MQVPRHLHAVMNVMCCAMSQCNIVTEDFFNRWISSRKIIGGRMHERFVQFALKYAVLAFQFNEMRL
jgi:hypothetical protein